MDKYKDEMDSPMELLAMALAGNGHQAEGLTDPQLVEVAIRHLRVMYKMLIATGANKELIHAALSE